MLTRPQTEVLARRRELFQLLDIDLFYKMRDWQKDFVKIFWSKPICDEDTFKLTLFLYNNCCPPICSCGTDCYINVLGKR